MSQINVITHDKSFHCDEVAGTALLSIIYEKIEIRRTRKDFDWINAECPDVKTVTIDVGGKYDHENGLYDHHQKSFNDTFNEASKVPLSSCGLIWKHYGLYVVEHLTNGRKTTNEMREKIWNNFYFSFIIGIDAHDNGIPHIKSPASNNIKYAYKNSLNLGYLVSKFNSIDTSDDDAQMKQFIKAYQMCKTIIIEALTNDIDSLIDFEINQTYFDECVAKSMIPEIVAFDRGINAVQYIIKHNRNKSFKDQIKFYIIKIADDNWKIGTMQGTEPFSMLMPIITQEAAAKLVGDDLIFVHKNRFCGAAKTCDAACAIIIESINKFKSEKNDDTFNVVSSCTTDEPTIMFILGTFIVGISCILMLPNKY